jgi:hypothetical protein
MRDECSGSGRDAQQKVNKIYHTPVCNLYTFETTIQNAIQKVLGVCNILTTREQHHNNNDNMVKWAKRGY